MPAKKELEKIFQYKSKINSTLSKYGYSQLEESLYWSSTEVVDYEFCAWGVTVIYGDTNYDAKNNSHSVRAVSAF